MPKFTIGESIGFNSIRNPIPSIMEHYMKNGASATFPHIGRIKHLMSIEKTLNKFVHHLKEK